MMAFSTKNSISVFKRSHVNTHTCTFVIFFELHAWIQISHVHACTSAFTGVYLILHNFYGYMYMIFVKLIIDMCR